MLNLKTKKIKDFVFAINKEKNCRALTPAEMKNLKYILQVVTVFVGMKGQSVSGILILVRF